MKNLALVLVISMSLVACKTNKQASADAAAAKTSGYNSGQSDSQANAVKASAVISSLYESYGSISYDFSLVKFGKDDANYAVISYNSGGPTKYLAIEVSGFTSGSSFNSYASAHPGLVFVNIYDNGNGTYTCGSGCYDGVGAATTSSMVFEKTTVASKDMDKAAAVVEALKVETMASNIASEFGLSDDRSIKVAKLASSWNKLAKTRALTNADADAFAQELAGVNFAQIDNADKAMMSGSMSEMNSIITKAADVNGTSSENMSAIMAKLFF